ncbi:hypothetical protein RISK_001011 [Rhodopirellula islandica]|uniref:Uncharacterized protein n=1 Tax=Rhodopirellula islandica TaxID=595434 RepID=A0A0J1BL04_RHOIS|nr:hypothetical protein RISK_001011 [Rhodopirellula islandica]
MKKGRSWKKSGIRDRSVNTKRFAAQANAHMVLPDHSCLPA